jgi:UDP-glucose 4-epimerase
MNICAVVGANGFLGRAIVKELLERKHAVYAVFNTHTEALPPNALKISIKEFITEGINEHIDTIFFSSGSFASTHEQLININCTLLSDIIKKYPESKIVFISSTSVYGNHNETVVETSAFNSPTLYGKSKLAGEFVAASAKKYAILRLAYLYGPGLNNGSFLTAILKTAIEKNTIKLNGNGERKQDYLYINDAVELSIKAMEHQTNEIFLGATGKSYSNLDIANLIALHIANVQIVFDGVETGKSFYFDPHETIEMLRWEPCIDISKGIKLMIG